MDTFYPESHDAGSPQAAPAHVTSLGLLALLEGTLFAPRETFARVTGAWTDLIWGLGWLSVVLLVVRLAQVFWKNESFTDGGLAFTVVWTLVAGWVTVVVVGMVIAGFAKVFNAPCSYPRLVTLLSVSSLPWLLYGPLAMLKVGLPFAGPLLAFFAGLALWGWQLGLFALALAESLQLTLPRALLLMVLPIGMTWWCFFGLSQLFTTFFRLLP